MKLTMRLGERSYDIIIKAGALNHVGELTNLRRREMCIRDRFDAGRARPDGVHRPAGDGFAAQPAVFLLCDRERQAQRIRQVPHVVLKAGRVRFKQRERTCLLYTSNMDQVQLSHFNDTAVAAVGNANQIITVVILTFSVVSLAAMILISQYRGAGDMSSVNRIYTLSALCNLVLSTAIAVLIIALRGPLFAVMHVPAEILPEARAYLVIKMCIRDRRSTSCPTAS